MYNLYRVKNICIAAYSVMYDPTFLFLPLVSVTGYFYLPLVYWPTLIAVEVRGEGVLIPTWVVHGELCLVWKE